MLCTADLLVNHLCHICSDSFKIINHFYFLIFFQLSHLLFHVHYYVSTVSIFICACYKKAFFAEIFLSLLNSATPYFFFFCLTSFFLSSYKFEKLLHSIRNEFNIVSLKYMPIQNLRV